VSTGKSLAERMREKREQAESKNPTLAERMRAKREAQQEENTMSLAERMKAKRDAEKKEKEPKATLAERMKAAVEDTVSKIDDVELDEEQATALAGEIEAIREQFTGLIRRVKLTDTVEDVSILGNKIEKLPEEIDNIRDRGYIFRAHLEDKVEVMAEQWDAMQNRVDDWNEDEAKDLDDDLEDIEKLLTEIGDELTVGDKRIKAKVETMLSILDEKVKVSEEQIETIYEEVERECNTTYSQINKIKTYLDQADEASFDFNSGENVFMVAKAEWDDGGEKPDGMFFVTNQRLIFEQKEKTGKRFGMFGGKEVQDVLWEAPINLLEGLEAENKGMMGGKDMLNMTFGSGAPYGHIVVELKGGVDNKYWLAQINRLRRGELDGSSVVEADDDLKERMQNAPTSCSTCGATLPQLMAGQTQLTCEYCGTSVRI